MTNKSMNERVIPLFFSSLFLLSGNAVADEALIAVGEQQAMVCKACHQFEPDGVTVVGPPLYGIAEREIASYPGFKYSDGLKQHSGKWDAEKLDVYLADPASFAPGTNMVFPGVADPGARAAIIAWLATKTLTRPTGQQPPPTRPLNQPVMASWNRARTWRSLRPSARPAIPCISSRSKD